MAKKEQKSDRRRRGLLVSAAETSKNRAEWRRLQRKNLDILGLLKRKEFPSVPQRDRLASMPEPSLPKEKGTEPSVKSARS